MSSVADVLKINPHCFQPSGFLKPFSQQYGEYEIAKLDWKTSASYGRKANNPFVTDRTPFVLSVNCAAFGVDEIADRPLIISKAAFEHIVHEHTGKVEKLVSHLNNLAGELAESVIAFGSYQKPEHVQFILSERTSSDNPVNVVIAVNLNQNAVDVAAVRTMYGNSHIVVDMQKSLDRGRRFYVNERTGAWLSNLTATGQLDPAGILGRHLSYLYDTQFPKGPHANLGGNPLAEGGPGASLESQRTLDRKGFPSHSGDVQRHPTNHDDTTCGNESLADQARAAIKVTPQSKEPSPTREEYR